jgi:drug/metabolite transporter (DMT)-like permease
MRNRPTGWANPWLHLVLSVILVTVSELFLKRGAAETASLRQTWDWTGVSGLVSPWVWCAIVLIILSFLTWLHVLRYLALSVAVPLSNAVYVLVPLCSWLFLGESISTVRWCGIALVLVGLIVVAKPVAHLEERL